MERKAVLGALKAPKHTNEMQCEHPRQKRRKKKRRETGEGRARMGIAQARPRMEK